MPVSYPKALLSIGSACYAVLLRNVGNVVRQFPCNEVLVSVNVLSVKKVRVVRGSHRNSHAGSD